MRFYNCGLLLILLSSFGIEWSACFATSSDNSHSIAKPGTATIPYEKTNATELLQRVSQRYSSLTYYKTNGKNEYNSELFEKKELNQFDFKLEYQHPSQIRIDWQENKKKKTFLSSNNTISLLENEKNEGNFSDVEWGLQIAASGNGQSRFEVGKILISKEKSPKALLSFFVILKEAQIISEEELDGNLCYVVQGEIEGDSLTNITYWIDKESLLIKKYERLVLAKKVPSGFFKTVETYSSVQAN